MLSVDEGQLLAHSLPLAVAQGAEEVVVVDNASTDRTSRVAGEHGARLVRIDQRVSYAAAINAGLRECRGEAVLLLNADCFAQPGLLAAMVRHLGDPGVGSVAPRLLRVTGAGGLPLAVDAAGMFIDRRRKNGLVGFGAALEEFRVCGEAFGADGAAALYRRQVAEECALAGGEVFDEDMELWASDADLAWRARLLGWRCVYEPRAEAHHVRSYSPANRRQMPAWGRRLQFRNRLLMIVKNETWAGLRRDGARILAYEVLAVAYALLVERQLLGGYLDAVRLLPGALRRRREIQARRRAVQARRPGEEVPFGLRPPP
jgi:GT2 family glycosyltransferase